MFRKENLAYGVLGYGRKKLIGVVGMGNSVGTTLVSKVLTLEAKKRGLNDRVAILDNPTNYCEMDTVVLVIDPLPSKIKENIAIYSELKGKYDRNRSFNYKGMGHNAENQERGSNKRCDEERTSGERSNDARSNDLIDSDILEKPEVFFLLNKMNSGTNLKELERFIKLDFIYIQDLISVEKIYAAEYADLSVEKNFEFDGIAELSRALF